MTNCEICPIRKECDGTKRRIINESVVDMHGYVWYALDSCPLIEIMMNKFESDVKNLTKVNGKKV